MALTGREQEVWGWDVQTVGRGECCTTEWAHAGGHLLSHHRGDPFRQAKAVPDCGGWFFSLRNLVHRG